MVSGSVRSSWTAAITRIRTSHLVIWLGRKRTPRRGSSSPNPRRRGGNGPERMAAEGKSAGGPEATAAGGDNSTGLGPYGAVAAGAGARGAGSPRTPWTAEKEPRTAAPAPRSRTG